MLLSTATIIIAHKSYHHQTQVMTTHLSVVANVISTCLSSHHHQSVVILVIRLLDVAYHLCAVYISHQHQPTFIVVSWLPKLPPALRITSAAQCYLVNINIVVLFTIFVSHRFNSCFFHLLSFLPSFLPFFWEMMVWLVRGMRDVHILEDF